MRWEEFRDLERTAKDYLMQPHTLPKADSLHGWSLQLQLWHFPSFSEHRSWAIYQHRERGEREASTVVRQTTWDYVRDSKRFSEPLTGLEQGFDTYPTIEIRDRPLNTADFQTRFKTLSSISFPAFHPQPDGLDGEFFGIALPEPGTSVWWWSDGPKPWQWLTQWAADAREWLSAVAAVPSEKG